MCSASAATKGFFSGVQSGEGAQRNNRALSFNAWMKEEEAKHSEIQAGQALAAGKADETNFRRDTERLKGEQRASFGASGAVVDSGSTLDTLLDTAAFGELDAMTIRRNAEIDSWEFREQALVSRREAGRLKAQKRDVVKEFLLGFLSGSVQNYASTGFNSGGQRSSSSGASGVTKSGSSGITARRSED